MKEAYKAMSWEWSHHLPGHRTWLEFETLYGMVLPVGRTHEFEDYGVKQEWPLYYHSQRPTFAALYKPLCLNSRWFRSEILIPSTKKILFPAGHNTGPSWTTYICHQTPCARWSSQESFVFPTTQCLLPGLCITNSNSVSASQRISPGTLNLPTFCGC